MSAATEAFTSINGASYATNGTDHHIPTSPILKNDERPFPSHLSVPYTNSNRASMASSIRLSRELDGLRWDGAAFDDSEFNENDSMFDAGEESEPLSPMESASKRNTTDPFGRQDEDTSQLSSYSALSKRADFILASAKRKLNVSVAKYLMVAFDIIAEFKSLASYSKEISKARAIHYCYLPRRLILL